MLPALYLFQDAVLLAFMLEAPEGLFDVLFVSEFDEYHEYHHLDRRRSPPYQPGGQFIFRPARRW